MQGGAVSWSRLAAPSPFPEAFKSRPVIIWPSSGWTGPHLRPGNWLPHPPRGCHCRPRAPGLLSGFDWRLRTRRQPPRLAPLFLSPPHSLPAKRVGIRTRLQPMGWRAAAQPPPPLRRRPIGIYYNVVATRGGGARGRAGWLRAGRPRSAEGRREGARRSLPLALWLPPSLRRRVSQSVRLQPASPGAAEGRSCGRGHFLLPLFLRQLRRAAGAGPRSPEPR